VKVSAEINRADLFWAHRYGLCDARVWGDTAIMVVGMIVFFTAIEYPQSLQASFLKSTLTSFLPLLIVLPLMGTFIPAFIASPNNGLIGARTYTLKDEGFHVRPLSRKF
jgi:hypothetical protein